MSRRTLVHDLEGGSEWTSLAAEIDDLERLCRSNNRHHNPPHARQPSSLRYDYHRRSTPQMQKATSVWIEPANDPPLLQSYPEEPCRWSWRPKTEFERAYFLDDSSYDRRRCDDKFSADKNGPYNSTTTEIHNNNSNERKKKNGKNGITEETTTSSYSGTRERLHEIFERNRYLRRKFFMGPGDADGYFGRGGEGRSGYGSTETIASQSNRSSVSSGDRRSRCRSNVTIEGEEGGDRFSHAGIDRGRRRRNEDEDDYYDGSMNVTRVEGGGILATSRNGKLLVNVVGQGDNFGKDLASNSRKINGGDSREAEDSNRGDALRVDCGSRESEAIDGCSRGDVWRENIGAESKPVLPRIGKMLDATWLDREEGDNSGKLPPDPLQNLCKSLPNLYAWRNGAREANKDSLFAEDIGESGTESRDEGKFCFFFSSQTDLSNPDLNSFTLRRLKVSKLPPPLDLSRVNERYEELERERSRSNDVRVSLIRNYNCPLEGRPTVVRDECSSDENREGSINDEGSSRERRVETAVSAIVEKNNQNYDSSLTNSSADRGPSESFDRNPSSELSERQVESVSEVGGNVREDKGEDRVMNSTSNLDKRRVEISSRDDDVCGRNAVGNSIEEKEEEEESWNKFLTAYLTTMDELQSPQLVNNCKNSMMDAERGETFHERRRRPPLSNHVNSMNGGQAGNGSTLPSVYGPIPYSQ